MDRESPGVIVVGGGAAGLAHFPIPRRYSPYLSRDEMVAYLDEYARHFSLRIETGVEVTRIHSRWIVDTANGDRWTARVVVIATGQYRAPIVPAWPGRETFAGTLTHSVTYANATPYVGQRVLVVGAGNSGAEIATDVCEHGATYVALSVRTPPPIVPRYGMPSPPEFAPYTTKRVPLIDVGFVEALKRQRIAIKPAVERLTSTGVVFADGTASRSMRSSPRPASAPASSR